MRVVVVQRGALRTKCSALPTAWDWAGRWGRAWPTCRAQFQLLCTVICKNLPNRLPMAE